jgi:hypothetical protein
MSDVTPGWRLVSIGTAETPVVLLGYELWRQKWLRCSGESIVVAHPSYPAERHVMFVYHLESAPSIIFAAGEFSNGVWGVFEPAIALEDNESLAAT